MKLNRKKKERVPSSHASTRSVRQWIESTPLIVRMRMIRPAVAVTTTATVGPAAVVVWGELEQRQERGEQGYWVKGPRGHPGHSGGNVQGQGHSQDQGHGEE